MRREDTERNLGSFSRSVAAGSALSIFRTPLANNSTAATVRRRSGTSLPRSGKAIALELVVGPEVEPRLIELQHEATILELVDGARLPEPADADEGRGVLSDTVLAGDKVDNRGINPAESRRIVGAGEGEGGVERLLDLLDAADVSFDARVALERKHRPERRTVVGVVEVAAARGRAAAPRGSRTARPSQISPPPSPSRAPHRIWIPREQETAAGSRRSAGGEG